MKTLLLLAVSRLLASASCVEVEGDKILYRDLARASAAFAAAPPEEPAAHAPYPGAIRRMSIAELGRLARAKEVPAEDLAPVCFVRKTQTLDRERIEATLHKALGEDASTIEILDFSRGRVPVGELEFPASGRTSAIWRGRVRTQANLSVPVWVKVRAPLAVERGATVAVEVHQGAASLEFTAKAESAGRTGDMVTVRNPANGRPFRGRVISKGKVRVESTS